jgi:hypothetical protein
MRAAALAAVTLTVGCACLASCAHAPRRTAVEPGPLLSAWSQAITHDQPGEAWKLLSPSLRAHLPEADFIASWRGAIGDLVLQQEALRGRWTVRRADAELPDGRALPLTREDDRWRIAAARPLSVGGETPEDTVRRLIAAVEARDFDALLALLAEPLRTTVEQAMLDRVDRLKSALRRGSLDSSGNPARIRYDSRYHLDLIQENGRWRIADFN